MITANQVLAHMVGDYILQSHWMATKKVSQFVPAAVHALLYSIVFLLFTPSFAAFAIILLTHFIIDRYRLARYVVWIKNGPWHPRTATGFADDVPSWLAVWLLIITDNVMHVTINGAALKWL